MLIQSMSSGYEPFTLKMNIAFHFSCVPAVVENIDTSFFLVKYTKEMIEFRICIVI